MRILVITARFPPYHLGGYELRSKDVVDQLAQRGYEIRVITSRKETVPKASSRPASYKIVRRLQIRKNSRHFFSEIICDFADVIFLEHQISIFQPDVIYLGHTICLSKAILPYLAGKQIPIVYDEGGIGLIHAIEKKGKWFYFVEDYISPYSLVNRIKPFVVNMINKVSANKIKTQWIWPDGMRIFFNSELNLRNALAKGVPVNGAKVIHSGIDAEKFRFIPRTHLNLPLSIIVPGRIEPQKGQKDAVRLLARLREWDIDGNIILVGENYSSSYYSEIEKEIKEFHLEDKVMLMPMVGIDKLMDLYHASDICFFPSYHKTGFSRVPLEAMACGCVVISYGNEGSNEVIRNEQTGFLVSDEDYSRMAKVIKKMILNPKMVEDVVHNARKEIEDNHAMPKYVDEVEAVIKDATSNPISLSSKPTNQQGCFRSLSRGLMAPILSVVICTYNRADRLEQCLDSLVKQQADRKDYEIIVVDNNSSDHTKDIANRFPVRYVIEYSQGTSFARNRGTRVSLGEYIAYLDDDVILPANWITEVNRILREYKGVDGMGGPIYPYYTSPKPIWWKDKYSSYMVRDASSFLENGQVFPGANMVLHKDLVLSIGGFDVTIGPKGNRFAFGEDTEICSRIWKTKPTAKLYYSLDLKLGHWVQPNKMTVGNHLKSRFLIGMASYYMRLCKTQKRTRVFFGELLNLFKEIAKALLCIRGYQYIQQWAIETVGPVCVTGGRICGSLGLRMGYFSRKSS